MWEIFASEFTGTFATVHVAVAAARLLIALVLGGLIGFERESSGKPAGLRTHMLVSMAACLFILVSQDLATLNFGDGEKKIDPLRLVEAVTAGVAFLAAGTIFSANGKVHNVTTGASMWLAGAIGLACGAGLVPLAALAALIVVIVLSVLRRLGQYVGDG